MVAEAAAAGSYEMEGFTPVPRLQIVTALTPDTHPAETRADV